MGNLLFIILFLSQLFDMTHALISRITEDEIIQNRRLGGQYIVSAVGFEIQQFNRKYANDVDYAEIWIKAILDEVVRDTLNS